MSDNTPDAPTPDPAAPAPGAYPPPAQGAYPPPAQPAPPAPPAYGAPAYGAAPQPGAQPAYGAQPPYGAQAPYGAQPQYPAAPQYGGPAYGYGAPAKTNTLAIVSLIASIAGLVIVFFIGSVVGVITGHMALNQLKTNGEQGRGLALAGTIVGWVGVGLSILGIVAFFSFLAFAASMSTSYSY